MDPFKAKADNDKMRELPHNVEAEQSLLGALMLSNESFEEIADTLLPEHFFVPVNGEIYKAISFLIIQGQVADPITLRAYFEQHNDLKRIEGGNYLVQLVNAVVSIAGISDYAKLIYDLYIRRRLILLGEQMSHDAGRFDLERTSAEQIEKAETELYNLAIDDRQNRCLKFVDIATDTIKTIEAAYKNDNKLIGITTGFVDLNDLLGGFNRSDLIILAGRPSMGKTALSTNMAFRIANDELLKRPSGGKVAFFSLEMSAEQLVERILSQESEIASSKVRRGLITADEFAKINNIKNKLADLNLFIEDTPAMTVSSLRTKARKLQRQSGLDLIVIDYLQLLLGSSDKRNDNRVQEISEITRALKAMAKELNIPIIALSQLSRAVEIRDDKRPQLADLRESGSIEQDADVVMFIYREEYYLERARPSEEDPNFQKWYTKLQNSHNKAELIIAKQRHGPIGTVELYFDSQLTKFDNLEKNR